MDTAFSHYLVPKIEKMSDSELAALLEKMQCTKEELPLILISDPGLKGLEVAPGDVVKVFRQTGKNDDPYYRQVVD